VTLQTNVAQGLPVCGFLNLIYRHTTGLPGWRMGPLQGPRLRSTHTHRRTPTGISRQPMQSANEGNPYVHHTSKRFGSCLGSQIIRVATARTLP